MFRAQNHGKPLPKENYASLQNSILILIFGKNNDGLYNIRFSINAVIWPLYGPTHRTWFQGR